MNLLSKMLIDNELIVRFNAGPLMGKVRGQLKWADGKEIKAQVATAGSVYEDKVDLMCGLMRELLTDPQKTPLPSGKKPAVHPVPVPGHLLEGRTISAENPFRDQNVLRLGMASSRMSPVFGFDKVKMCKIQCQTLFSRIDTPPRLDDAAGFVLARDHQVRRVQDQVLGRRHRRLHA